MSDIFNNWIIRKDRCPAHQVTLDCIFDAVRYGDDFPILQRHLNNVVRDATYWPSTRLAALNTWLIKLGGDTKSAEKLLTDIASGKVQDADDQLCGTLLMSLYPTHIDIDAVLKALHPAKEESLIGNYHMFWALHFLRNTPRGLLPDLADKFAKYLQIKRATKGHVANSISSYELGSLAGKLLVKALKFFGETAQTEQIYAWCCRRPKIDSLKSGVPIQN